MTDKKTIIASFLVIAVIGVGVSAALLSNVVPQQVPPPDSLPDETVDIVTSGDLRIWAEAVYWQDFMPSVPPEGPPFYTVITVNITNDGDVTITDIFAPRVTIYYNSTFNALVTLNLTTVNQYFAPLSVSPGESVEIEFTNVRSTIFSPSIDEGTALYSRVLFHWENGETILTTVPTELSFTY